MKLLRQEPVIAAAVIQVAVAVAGAYGFGVSASVLAAVLSAMLAVLGVAVRQRVTPVGIRPPMHAVPPAPQSPGLPPT